MWRHTIGTWHLLLHFVNGSVWGKKEEFLVDGCWAKSYKCPRYIFSFYSFSFIGLPTIGRIHKIYGIGICEHMPSPRKVHTHTHVMHISDVQGSNDDIVYTHFKRVDIIVYILCSFLLKIKFKFSF